MKQMLDEPVSMARLLVPSARPPATQLVASVTSLPPVQVPAPYAVLATAAVRSGVTPVPNRAALTSASATSPAYVVGKPEVAATPRAIGLSIACWKILESVHAKAQPSLSCSGWISGSAGGAETPPVPAARPALAKTARVQVRVSGS